MNWERLRNQYTALQLAHVSQAFSTYTSACDCTDSEHLPWTV